MTLSEGPPDKGNKEIHLDTSLELLSQKRRERRLAVSAGR